MINRIITKNIREFKERGIYILPKKIITLIKLIFLIRIYLISLPLLLIIKGFREGEQVKTDEVNIYALDFETLKYSDSEDAVVIKCFADIDGCVMRILQKERKKKTFRNRLIFATPKGKTGLEIEEKLRLFLLDLSKNTK